MAEKPVLILSARGRPIEVTVLVACLFTGILGLIGQQSRTSTNLDIVLGGFGWIWYVGMIVGGVLSLASIFFKFPNNLLWERIGLMLLTTFFFGFSFIAITFSGFLGLRSTLFLLFFGVGFLFRVRQITRDLRLLEKAVEESR